MNYFNECIIYLVHERRSNELINFLMNVLMNDLVNDRVFTE